MRLLKQIRYRVMSLRLKMDPNKEESVYILFLLFSFLPFFDWAVNIHVYILQGLYKPFSSSTS